MISSTVYDQLREEHLGRNKNGTSLIYQWLLVLINRPMTDFADGYQQRLLATNGQL